MRSISFVLRALLFVSCCCIATAQTPTPVLTQGYDSARDGLDATETTLTPANVNPATFGKLFNLPVDGFMYAQPLYVPGIAISGQGTHNVVYVATMHDSIYAFDADGLSAQPLWHVSFINPSGGVTTEPVSDNGNNTDTDGEIGILSTPVIDASTGTLYVLAKTDETSGQTTNQCFRLHALDITSGAERTGSPTGCIQASVPGTGSPNSGGNVLFSSLYTLQRPGLALSGNNVYAAFGSWGDSPGWHGWVLSYNKSTLQLANALNITPNGSEGEGGIWASGRGLAVDASGNLFVTTGNGNFDGASNYGDSFLKLSPTLGITDYFTPYDQQALDNGDLDVATGGVVLLPDSAGTTSHPHIMIGCGKNGTIYVIDRDNLGQYNSKGDTQIIQEIYNQVGGIQINPGSSNYVENCYSGGTYWNGHVYFGGITDSVKEFNFTNGLLSTSPVSQTPEVYQFPGANAVVSANGSTNGILWAIENAGSVDAGRAGTTVLHAYDATNLGTELYSSSQSASDTAGGAVKFTMPTVANGKVYVGTQGSVAAYGLFSSMPQASTPVFSPAGGSYSGSVSLTISDASPGTTIYYTTDGTTPTVNSSVYTGPILLSNSATVSAIAVGGGYRFSSDGVSTYVINGVAPITFAQVASATPQTSVSTVSVSYPSAEGAGDMNIVVVGWNDTTASVQSVTDTAGNTYKLAVGPTSGTGVRQSIYYASGIVGGSNTVTVNFSPAAAEPDIRILEYRGVTTLDVTAGASGSGTTASSGSASIHSNNELIFGADTISTVTNAAGTGFTARIITVPDSDLAEDQIASNTGSYSATATLASGAWVMQMAAFSAAPLPAPTISSVSPSSGSTAGGTAVTITGTNFVAGATVNFGTAAATNVTVVNSTTITATTPAGSAGAVNVTVTQSGQSSSLTNGFTYIVGPSVTSVSPNTGPIAGSTAVTITGTNFASGATVTFGTASATNITVVNSTSITATTPAGTAGPVTVTVTSGGQSGSLTSGFTYVAQPTVSSVSPSSGSTAGGTTVTITGTNFASGATVTFGTASASNVTVVNSTTITAKTPAGTAGPVTVTVTQSGQSGSLINGFTYVVTPSVTSVSPSSGPATGGTAVTITGTNFASGATVTFGTAFASNVTVVNSTTITATTPAGSAGPVTVTVTSGGQSGSLTSGFTYIGQPTVTSVSPSSGPTTGGTAVTITGTNFASGATVTFGTASGTNVTVVNSTTITATTPAGSAGAVTVTVTNPGPQSGSLASGFTYTTSVAISYVQVAAATPQSTTSTVSVSYPSAQTAGDMNIVVVGWNDTTASVQSVTDSAGNTYKLAIGPTSGSGVRQSIYYASGIKAGSNTVTVNFSPAAAYPDIRVLEYRGVSTLDVTAGASGSGTTASSGSATTTSANELIFGADTISSVTTAAGSGFTSRIITSPDSDLAEDKTATAVGSYSATATLSSGLWVMQMATFSAAPPPTPTVTSINPSSGSTAGGTAVTITGTNFVAGATVNFGSAAATNVTVVNGTTITATTPAGSAGAVNVSVTQSGQSGSLTNGFTYVVTPTVSSVSPNSGPTAGGTAVTITGTNFASGATVTFGTASATNVTVVNSTTITATTPAGSAGPVAVTVTSNGQSGSLTSGFTYVLTPTVSSISPSSGSTAGGTSATVTGTNFAAGATVTFGTAAATNVTVVNSTTITATTPAGSAGAVNVTVTQSGQSGILTNGFTYVVTPTVSSVSPSTGPTTGGTAVTITGTNFASGATVTFGGAPATNITVVNSTSITATTPAGSAGPVTVTVTSGGQSGSLTNGFTYVVTPTVTGVSPSSGSTAGGTSVTITGTNFASGATVTFGSASATSVAVVNSTTITAKTPAGTAGPVTVTVTQSGQSGSLTNGFTYVVTPTVTSVNPNSGPATGGTAVTITGTNFASGATVTFGTAAATNVTVVSSTSITATTPAGSAGPVTVTVTSGGQSGSLTSGFTYIGQPSVTGVSPSSGPTTGGTAVTITGTNFATGATVTFGTASATNVTVVNSTTITATTPAGSAGAVTVTVTNPGPQSGSLTSGFTYTTSVAISYAQVASATPQSPTSTVSVSYPSGQTAGDLNIVVVGWNDTTASVQSVTDSAGNTYKLAIGPTSGTGLRQSIYYASGINAGSNTITVSFNQAAAYPDIRVLEYRGVSTLDVSAGASGSGTTASSGSATTTSANELIFGANIVAKTTTGAGTGFTSRIVTKPDSDIAEDEIVTTAGSYSATAKVSSGAWVMQMATFK